MGKNLIVVLDTNVWVSIVFSKTLTKDFVPLIREEKIKVYLSRALVRELAKVLTYPKIEAILEKANIEPTLALSSILKSVTLVKTKQKIQEIMEDPADNRVLGCALSAKAKIIVSGDRHLQDLHEFRGIRIMSPRDFLDELK